MPSTHAVVQHLPFLRRYARALTGSQVSGDAAVRAALEAIIQDASLIRPGAERVSLYRVFHAIWTTSEDPVKRHATKHARRTGISQRLATLGVVPREALLLTMMEGFAPEEAAQILGCSPADVAELVEAALTELRAPVPSSILIIEDEPVISLDLSQLVTEMGHNVMAVARTHQEAVDAVRDSRPALILADVQLADDSSGIEAVEEILQQFDVPTVFVTAFPERLLTGDRREPAYLITKPFVPQNVKTIVGHALSVAETAAPAA
jgi:CheY-like chemotaxis protein/DNA-directed RNA polymerase specialized sigma24 family protein